MNYGFDTETHLMGTGRTAPPLVCVQVAARDPETGNVETEVVLKSDPRALQLVWNLLRDPDVHLAGSFIAYDMRVCANEWPQLWPVIFDAYEAGRIHDVCVMDKLSIISTTGDLDYYTTPDGSKGKLGFSQAEIENRRLGVDRSTDKKGPDVWRLRYAELESIPVEEWPADALSYAKDDPVGALLLYENITAEASDEGHGSIKTEAFQAAADFALSLATAWGMTVDPARVERMAEVLEEELGPARMKPLYDAGLLTPGVAPGVRTRVTKAGDVVPVIDSKTGEPKIKKGKAEKKNSKEIRKYVEEACNHYGITVPRVASGEAQADADIVGQIATRGDPLMKLLAERERLAKLRSTYVPVLANPHGLVHFNFNVLVTSGRTSSYGGKYYASANGQNQPRIGGDFSVRECYEARPGRVLSASDFGGLELCSVADTTESLFPGQSEHFRRNKEGVDFHAFLGAQIAAALDPDFGAVVNERGLNRDDTYQAFLKFKTSDNPELRRVFAKYRRFAKPTGLGYPGGLGPATFIVFARATYGVDVDIKTAELLRKVWFSVYPEMRRYFAWVNSQGDPRNAGKYAYQTPMGMYRAACGFTEAANGMAMQSPSAEGAKIAGIRLARECYDKSQGSVLFGSNVVNFIHDEYILEHDEDDRVHEKVLRVEQIMRESMNLVLTKVDIVVESALMRRWYKEAEAVYDDRGRITVWEPQKNED